MPRALSNAVVVCYRRPAATRRFQYAMKASMLSGIDPRASLAKGARMPSTADEVCAETRNASLRAAGDLRCGFDCLRFTTTSVPRH